MDGNLDSSCARVDEAKRLIGSHSKIEKSRARAYKKSVRMPCACSSLSPPTPPAVRLSRVIYGEHVHLSSPIGRLH